MVRILLNKVCILISQNQTFRVLLFIAHQCHSCMYPHMLNFIIPTIMPQAVQYGTFLKVLHRVHKQTRMKSLCPKKYGTFLKVLHRVHKQNQNEKCVSKECAMEKDTVLLQEDYKQFNVTPSKAIGLKPISNVHTGVSSGIVPDASAHVINLSTCPSHVPPHDTKLF